MTTYNVEVVSKATQTLQVKAETRSQAIDIAKSSVESQCDGKLTILSTEAREVLDYDKPIIAFDANKGFAYILVTRKRDNLGLTYDWLSLKTGCFNSDIEWTSKQLAVEAYQDIYTIQNGYDNIESIFKS